MEFKLKMKYVTGSQSDATNECHFSRFDDLNEKPPIVWWSTVNGVKVFIKQTSHRSEISEKDIVFEPNVETGIITQKHEIVKAFNEHLGRMYN